MLVQALDYLNRHGKAFAVRVRGVHPKHLVEVPGHAWYLEHIAKGDVVIDIGSGTGAHAKRAVDLGAHVYCFDRPAFDAERKWTIPDEWCDVVMMLDVLEHLHHREHALKEARRVLKPGGKFLLAVPNSETQWRSKLRRAGLFAFSDPDHKVEYTRIGLEMTLKRHDFTILSLTPATYDTPLAGVMDALGALYLPLYRVFATYRHRRAELEPQESTGFRVVAVK